uniref:Glycosyltransferase family 92 protein n=1 Tax=Syphacia muris TaxID=451379 RepID=A0A0N5ACQ1_9BILA
MEFYHHTLQIFIHSTYLTSDYKILVSFIAECFKKNQKSYLYVTVDGGSPLTTTIAVVNTCPSNFKPSCHFGGHIATVNDLQPSTALKILENRSKLEIFSSFNPSFKQQLILTDLRASNLPSFKLGVCMHPVMHFADWTVIPQFFEMWIEHGARKFYFYIHSISKEVDDMLKIYENDPLINVERIQWGPFKVNKTANEVHVINDCIRRARSRVRYLAIADFDETFITIGQKSLLSMLDETIFDNPMIGSFKFRSHVANFNNTYLTIKHPKEISFDTYNNISLEKEPLPKDRMTKV